MFRSCDLSGHTISWVQQSGRYHRMGTPEPMRDQHFEAIVSLAVLSIRSSEGADTTANRHRTEMPLSADCHLIGEPVLPR